MARNLPAEAGTPVNRAVCSALLFCVFRLEEFGLWSSSCCVFVLFRLLFVVLVFGLLHLVLFQGLE